MAGALVGDSSNTFPDTQILTVLDPRSGKQVAGEPLIVAAVGYGAAATEDQERWYVFQSDQLVEPTPESILTLQIRTLDRATATWTTVGSGQVPTMISGSLVVLNKRLAYLTYGRNGNQLATKRSLVLLDVAGDTIAPLANDESWDVEDAQGLVGIPSTTDVGGVLDVIGVTPYPCGLSGFGMCDVTGRVVTTIGPGVNSGAKKPLLSFLSATGAQATWTTTGTNNRLLVAAPSDAFNPANQQGIVRPFSASGLGSLGAGVKFDASGKTFRSLSYDACNDVAFFSELNQDQALFAQQLSAPRELTVESLGKPGQRVAFEPISRSVLVPFIQGATRSLRAFAFDGSVTPPKLTERLSDWTPPATLGLGPAAFRTQGASCDGML